MCQSTRAEVQNLIEFFKNIFNFLFTIYVTTCIIIVERMKQMLNQTKEAAEILVALVTARYLWHLGSKYKLENQQLKNKDKKQKDGS